jgi:hypothetical protein
LGKSAEPCADGSGVHPWSETQNKELVALVTFV